MSSARCLNWSRPPPGRHPAAAVLRKQVSCSEQHSSASGSLALDSALSTTGGHRPSTVNTLSTAFVQHQQQQQQQTPPPADGCDHFCQFLVTGAIIHTNRFQNYHTYNQAHRGASGSGSVTPLGYQQHQHPSLSQRRRPSSASAGGAGAGGGGGSGCSGIVDPAATAPGDRARLGRRAILCKQLSLDQSILVAATAASSIASGMAAVANAAAEGQSDGSAIERGWGFGRKQAPRIGTGTGMKSEMESGGKKSGPKGGKDSRINIKIFLGQTVQQDSSDTGISDTETPTPPATTTTATAATSLQKSDSTPAMSSTTPTEPYSTFTGSGSKGNRATIQASCTSSGSQSSTSGSSSAGSTGVGSGGTTSTTSGRSSSLAQRRAQFQANRQNSEAHDRRHPPLVRAMSAPIRPADPDTSKFLQSKKKPRRRKVLREKDEYNIYEEDEYSDEGGNIISSSGSSNNGTGILSTSGGSTVKGSSCNGNGNGLPLRSRSVLGGACDIETLVSLLSSGGSDSEKEQEQQHPTQNVPPNNGPPTGGHGAGSGVALPASFRQPFTSAHLKGRAPMLKKTGKSVSFQESDLKPPVANAGLNRDYRKPTFQPTVANRVRRAVHTLNAFQLKDREKSDEKEPSEEKCATDWLNGEKDAQSPKDSSPSAEHPAKQGTAGGGGGKATETTGKAATTAAVGTNGDLLQSPKEQECYRLYLKMSKKGLAVSYDTILRGMLTPTELRVLQKKKSRCQRADDGDGAKDENVIGSEDDMLSPGENGPLSVAIPSLKESELFPLSCQPGHTNAGHGILTIPEEPTVIEHEFKASDSDGCGGGAAVTAHVS